MHPITGRANHSIPSNGAVLVVEDDECLRTIVGTMFSLQARTVFTACDGEEGQRQFQLHKNELSLVMIDLGLPKIEGAELIKRFRAAKPSLIIVATSGYNDKEFIRGLLKDGVDVFLRKPFSQAELYALVRQFMGTARLSGEKRTIE